MTAYFCHCSLCFAVIIFICDGIFLLLIFLPNSEGCHYSECDQASDLWQQLVLASALEMDLQETIDCSKKVIVDFNTGKMQLVSLENTIVVKMVGSVLEEKLSFKILQDCHRSWKVLEFYTISVRWIFFSE